MMYPKDTAQPDKRKTCRQCGSSFTPARPMQSVCSPICATRKVKADKKEETRQTRERKEAIKPRAKWLAEAQAIVNKYVRLRDRDLPCCSCDRPASWDGQWHASHLRSVGAASSIRFNLWNIAKSCSICNNHLSGNIGNYLPRARERMGDKRIDWLYTQNHIASYPVDYLMKFKRVMGKKLKRLEKRIGMQG